jgi:hypothetical protein
MFHDFDIIFSIFTTILSKKNLTLQKSVVECKKTKNKNKINNKNYCLTKTKKQKDSCSHEHTLFFRGAGGIFL